uniref:Uncharacterized protein n=1 Tax=Anguilla anguilla TaxID=7936 RepID=A0A0E9Q942_ANGAN
MLCFESSGDIFVYEGLLHFILPLTLL